MIHPETEQDTSKGTLDTSGLTVNIYTLRKETNMHVKKPVDVILLCIRLDDLFRVEVASYPGSRGLESLGTRLEWKINTISFS